MLEQSFIREPILLALLTSLPLMTVSLVSTLLKHRVKVIFGEIEDIDKEQKNSIKSNLGSSSENAETKRRALMYEMNQSRITQYHKIALNQASISFYSAQIATIAGLVLIIVVAFIIPKIENTTVAISTGALGAIGGSLSAYIGSTFVKSQISSSSQLRQLFNQPTEYSKLLDAERIAEELEGEHKAEALKLIVASLVLPSQEQKKSVKRSRKS